MALLPEAVQKGNSGSGSQLRTRVGSSLYQFSNNLVVGLRRNRAVALAHVESMARYRELARRRVVRSF
jgi:hypothetical protein